MGKGEAWKLMLFACKPVQLGSRGEAVAPRGVGWSLQAVPALSP